MPAWMTRAWDFVKQVVSEFQEDDIMGMAAALSYYTVFSLAPMLLIVIVVMGLVVSPEEAQKAVNGQFEGLVGQQGAEQIATMIEGVQANPGGSLVARVLGIIAVLFGATGVMVQLQAALNRAWDVKPDPNAGGIKNFFLKRVLSFGMILGVAFLLLVSLAMTAILAAVSSRAESLIPDWMSEVVAQVLNQGISFVVVALLFAAIFKIMPEAKIQWKDVAVGALVTAILFTIGKTLIGLYLGNSNVGTAYGAASSLAIVFVWVYYSSVIVLLGAEFTQVWTRRYGAGLEPQKGAVIAVQEERIVGTEPQPATE